jgi:PhnB protein
VARVSTYLNFVDTTEKAFEFYRSVFGGEFIGGIARFGDMPPAPDQPPMTEADKKLVMHIELAILGGHAIMGTDAPQSMGFTITQGNNVHINLEPDTREEADRLFQGLSAGGKVEMPMQDMFWGAYWGNFTDKFGTKWMINVNTRS